MMIKVAIKVYWDFLVLFRNGAKLNIVQYDFALCKESLYFVAWVATGKAVTFSAPQTLRDHSSPAP